MVAQFAENRQASITGDGVCGLCLRCVGFGLRHLFGAGLMQTYGQSRSSTLMFYRMESVLHSCDMAVGLPASEVASIILLPLQERTCSEIILSLHNCYEIHWHLCFKVRWTSVWRYCLLNRNSWRYIAGGGEKVYCLRGTSSSQIFMGARWGWSYIGGWLYL
jgi:hypothetical protein